MYRSFFKLDRLPFRNTPDETFYFVPADRAHMIEALEYALERRDGIITVTGEVGCGKTFLLRMLSRRLENRFHLVYIPTPRMNPEEMLTYIAQDLGIETKADESKAMLFKKLYGYLLNAYEEGRIVVILIDEAHTMPPETLEEVRLLTNIETASEKLLTIVLFGQPELEQLLDREDMRQLKSRISYTFQLDTLNPEQVHGYLNFRMRRAGYDGEDVFSPDIARRIHRMTKGVPRLINNLADKLLMSAYVRGSHRVEKRDLANSQPSASRHPFTRRWPMAGAAAAVILAGGLTLWWQQRTAPSPVEASADTAASHAKQAPAPIQTPPQSAPPRPQTTPVADQPAPPSQSEPDTPDEPAASPILKAGSKIVSYSRRHQLDWPDDQYVVLLNTFPCGQTIHLPSSVSPLIGEPSAQLGVFAYEDRSNTTCSLFSGPFADIPSSRAFIRKLPETARRYGPFANPISKFKNFIRRHQGLVLLIKHPIDQK